MSIFSSIMSKIFHPDTHVAAGGDATTPPPSEAAAATPPPVSSAPVAPVDVEAVLTQMAAQGGGGGNWQTSIVDLLKLLNLDSSLESRKQLASELNVHVGADGTAEENIALHKAVMQKLAENGGKVPSSMTN